MLRLTKMTTPYQIFQERERAQAQLNAQMLAALKAPEVLEELNKQLLPILELFRTAGYSHGEMQMRTVDADPLRYFLIVYYKLQDPASGATLSVEEAFDWEMNIVLGTPADEGKTVIRWSLNRWFEASICEGEFLVPIKRLMRSEYPRYPMTFIRPAADCSLENLQATIAEQYDDATLSRATERRLTFLQAQINRMEP